MQLLLLISTDSIFSNKSFRVSVYCHHICLFCHLIAELDLKFDFGVQS